MDDELKISEFLGEEIEEGEKKPEEKEEEKDKEEKSSEEPKKLGMYEFIYTDEGNVLMSKEAYEKLMEKYFGSY